jgi:hypothetical protein
MAGKNLWEGAIAGAISGFVIALAVTIFLYFSMKALVGDLLNQMSGVSLLEVFLLMVVIWSIISLIIGVVYSVLYNSIPTTSPVIKGIILLVACWVINLFVHVGLNVNDSLTTLIFYIVQGAILGLLFDRLAAPSRQPYSESF